ncbi:cytochrome c-type biogenesis protein [Thioclava sp. GXIMD4215]|uniref:cytochrome c-type biogenesis protein n=1 Tax=Thioclava sp. GXIMD4215 TaxID=3131928 RepID=UPI003245E482
MIRILLCALSFVMLQAAAVLAVQPDEILPDPALEARARALSTELRCPVCQGEDIDDSNAAVARDLRRLVRERLVAGDTDQQVLDYVTARYGEYVLFSPEAKGANLLLYWAGPATLLIALGSVVVWVRRRARRHDPRPEALSVEEKARLDEILKG